MLTSGTLLTADTVWVSRCDVLGPPISGLPASERGVRAAHAAAGPLAGLLLLPLACLTKPDGGAAKGFGPEVLDEASARAGFPPAVKKGPHSPVGQYEGGVPSSIGPRDDLGDRAGDATEGLGLGDTCALPGTGQGRMYTQGHSVGRGNIDTWIAHT